MAEPLLKAENLKKYFTVGRGKVLQAVDGVSFSVNRGQTLGLVGESGCGKTTVGRTLMHIYEPDGGTIRFDGEDITHIKGNQAKAQERFALNDCTVSTLSTYRKIRMEIPKYL